MNRRVVALRVLCERPVADRFENLTSGMKVAQISLHLQSVLAAALINPAIVVKDIVRGKAMALQVSNCRGSLRPVLLSLPCNGAEEREVLRRLVQALTWEVGALMAGPDLPDASTIVRALLREWMEISKLNREYPSERRGGVPHGIGSQGNRKPRPARTQAKKSTSGAPRMRRRKSVEQEIKPDRPHAEHPDVSATPISWKPGGRGRPPLGAFQSDDGTWHLPEDFLEIRGNIHPPLAIFRSAKSVREILRQVGQKDRRKRLQRQTKERMEAQESTGHAQPLPKATPQPTDAIPPKMTPEQSPRGDAIEAPPGEPPSAKADGGHPAGPQSDG